MDNETVGVFIAGVVSGMAAVGFVTAGIGAYMTNKRGRKKAIILDREYGPKIKGNLTRLETAVQKGDRQEAFVALADRNALLNEIDALAPAYISGSWNGFAFASDEVKKYVAKGASLKAYLKA